MAEEKMIAEYQSRDGQTIKLSFETVRKYLVSGKANLVTDQEIIFYVGMCKARGLNPFKRDCYLVKYTENDPAAIIVSIDYFRSRARAQEDCRGWQAGIIVLSKEGEIVKRAGAFMMPGDGLLGGWFRGKPATWEEPYEWSVNVQPYVKKTREGTDTRFWREENQAFMICKVAESQGLRRLWPDEFQGIYTEDEMPRDVTPEPLKMPQESAAREQKGVKKHENTSNDESKKQDADMAQADREGSKRSRDTAESSSAGAIEARKAEALTWIKEATRADWENAPKNWLETTIKGMNNKDQIEVCRAWNERKKAESVA